MCVGRLFERQTIIVINKVMFVCIYTAPTTSFSYSIDHTSRNAFVCRTAPSV